MQLFRHKGKAWTMVMSIRRLVCSIIMGLTLTSIYCVVNASNFTILSSFQASGTQLHSSIRQIKVSDSQIARTSERGDSGSCNHVYTRAAQPQISQRSQTRSNLHAQHSVPSSASGPKIGPRRPRPGTAGAFPRQEAQQGKSATGSDKSSHHAESHK